MLPAALIASAYLIVSAYLIGSIPFSYLVVRVFAGADYPADTAGLMPRPTENTHASPRA